jgi:transposase
MIDEENGMPAKRELTMRQLRYLLRLRHDGVSTREIGRLLGVARSTIQDNLKRVATAGLQWPLPEEATDEVLELQLFGRSSFTPGHRRRVEPDWAALARELKRPGVSMMILWEEYREAQPGGYGYSRSRATKSSSITRASGLASPIPRRARSGKPRFSSPCLARPI